MITFIDTASCERVKLPELQGEFAEIVNKKLCGAEDVVGTLRWLKAKEQFTATARDKSCQLVYLMEGKGMISLQGKDHEVSKGAGMYLDLGEQAGITNVGDEPLKLFHLVVPEKRD